MYDTFIPYFLHKSKSIPSKPMPTLEMSFKLGAFNKTSSVIFSVPAIKISASFISFANSLVVIFLPYEFIA